MAKWRDKVLFVSGQRLRLDGTRRVQVRDRIHLPERALYTRNYWEERWIVVEQPFNMDGFVVVEETPQGEWIAATIAFLRWVLRIYGWIVCHAFRLYHWVYRKIPRPDPYGTFRLPFTPFWSGEGIRWVGDQRVTDSLPAGSNMIGMLTGCPYWIVGWDPASDSEQMTALERSQAGQIVRVAQAVAPRLISGGSAIRSPLVYRAGDAILPTPQSPAQRDPA